MGKPNIIGAGITITAGALAMAYLPGLYDTSFSRMFGETKTSVIQRYERLREVNLYAYKMIKPGIDLGLKLFYKER